MRRIQVLVLAATGAVALCGAENAWRLQLGVSYRDFGDVELDSYRLRNYGSMAAEGGPFGIQGYSVLPGLRDGSGVTADQVSFRGEGESADEAWSPVVGVQRELWRRGSLSLSLTGSLAYYRTGGELGSRGSAASPGRFRASHFNYLVAGEQVLAPPINDEPLPGFSPGTSAAVRLDEFRLDLLVLDVGLRGQYEWDRFYLTLGLGPAFYWADAESEVVESGAWNAIPGTGDPGSYRLARSDSDSDVAVGVYASLGAGVQLSERIAVEVEYRRDEVGGGVGTSQAELELSGQTGMVKVVIGF
jgi:opacity protein-like surface antigen